MAISGEPVPLPRISSEAKKVRCASPSLFLIDSFISSMTLFCDRHVPVMIRKEKTIETIFIFEFYVRRRYEKDEKHGQTTSPILINKGKFTVWIFSLHNGLISSINESTGLTPFSALYFCTDDQVPRYP